MFNLPSVVVFSAAARNEDASHKIFFKRCQQNKNEKLNNLVSGISGFRGQKERKIQSKWENLERKSLTSSVTISCATNKKASKLTTRGFGQTIENKNY